MDGLSFETESPVPGTCVVPGEMGRMVFWTSGCQWCVCWGAHFDPRECLIMTGDLLGCHRWVGDAGISCVEARCLAAHVQCPTLCNPTDCSPPGSSVHGISQVRILEWVVISSFRGSSQGLNLRLQHWQADSLPLNYLGNSGTLKLVLCVLCYKISWLREC